MSKTMRPVSACSLQYAYEIFKLKNAHDQIHNDQKHTNVSFMIDLMQGRIRALLAHIQYSSLSVVCHAPAGSMFTTQPSGACGLRNNDFLQNGSQSIQPLT